MHTNSYSTCATNEYFLVNWQKYLIPRIVESVWKKIRQGERRSNECGAATAKKQERCDVSTIEITIPSGLSFDHETSPSADTANNPISELRLTTSDEPLSNYRGSRIDRLWWHGTHWNWSTQILGVPIKACSFWKFKVYINLHSRNIYNFPSLTLAIFLFHHNTLPN